MAHFVNNAYFSLASIGPTVRLAWHRRSFGGSRRAFETFVAVDRSHALRGELHNQPVDAPLRLGRKSGGSPRCGPAQLSVIRSETPPCRVTARDQARRRGSAEYGVSRQRGDRARPPCAALSVPPPRTSG